MYKLKTDSWYLERILFLIAGTFVLGSIFAGFYVHPYFFYFAGFVGLSQLVFALTGWCLMAIILRSCGVKGKLEK